MTKPSSILIVIIAVSMAAALPLGADPLLNAKDSPFSVSFDYEAGFLKVLSHTYQVGTAGTAFDFVNEGGQEILFPFERYEAKLDIGQHNRIGFLYQPLVVNTTTTFRSAVTIDQTTFSAGDAVVMKYGFPFWRLTWDYRFDLGGVELGTGLALQLRDASISFQTPDGSKFAGSQNLGPVPALHLSLDWMSPAGFGLFAEATGIYASSAIINGASFSFEGSLLDVSVRPKVRLRDGLEAFLNVRYLGGTAVGTSSYSSTQWSTSVERFTSNKLSTMSVTLGAKIS